MAEIATIGLDLAKRVFQVHAADAAGREVLRRKLRRSEVEPFFAALPPCLVAMEACATAHHWARLIAGYGHDARLIPPQYVAPYVRRHKTDAADAAAICEAASRPSMRFVPVKTPDQQAVLALHRTRALLVKQRTMLANAIRAHLAEHGEIEAQGITRVRALAAALAGGQGGEALPELARCALRLLAGQFVAVDGQIGIAERAILAWHREQEASRRLASVPGIGPVTASAIVATIGEVGHFRSGRELAAWLGLTPRQHSSGGKERIGRISKRGDSYLRRLLVSGAMVVIRHARGEASRMARSALGAWVRALLARQPAMLVAVALANKLARIAWAVLARGEPYRPDGPVRQPA